MESVVRLTANAQLFLDILQVDKHEEAPSLTIHRRAAAAAACAALNGPTWQ